MPLLALPARGMSRVQKTPQCCGVRKSRSLRHASSHLGFLGGCNIFTALISCVISGDSCRARRVRVPLLLSPRTTAVRSCPSHAGATRPKGPPASSSESRKAASQPLRQGEPPGPMGAALRTPELRALRCTTAQPVAGIFCRLTSSPVFRLSASKQLCKSASSSSAAVAQ